MSERLKAKRYARDLRKQIIAAYGGKCACCGESRFHFLTIDHTNNDGLQHMQSLRKNSGRTYKHSSGRISRTSGSIPFWNDLKRRGYPKDGYRCLCYNCNMGRERNWEHPGICPHELERGQIVSVPLRSISVTIGTRQLSLPSAVLGFRL